MKFKKYLQNIKTIDEKHLQKLDKGEVIKLCLLFQENCNDIFKSYLELNKVYENRFQEYMKLRQEIEIIRQQIRDVMNQDKIKGESNYPESEEEYISQQ